MHSPFFFPFSRERSGEKPRKKVKTDVIARASLFVIFFPRPSAASFRSRSTGLIRFASTFQTFLTPNRRKLSRGGGLWLSSTSGREERDGKLSHYSVSLAAPQKKEHPSPPPSPIRGPGRFHPLSHRAYSSNYLSNSIRAFASGQIQETLPPPPPPRFYICRTRLLLDPTFPRLTL